MPSHSWQGRWEPGTLCQRLRVMKSGANAIVTPSVAHCISIIQSFIYQVLPDCLLPRYLEKWVLPKRQVCVSR
jgi:hypothetical protein